MSFYRHIVMLDETVVRRTNKVSEGLRTTIPKAVINMLGLEEDNHLNWKVEAIPGHGGTLRVYVEKGE